jgi:hypothetical protein
VEFSKVFKGNGLRLSTFVAANKVEEETAAANQLEGATTIKARS